MRNTTLISMTLFVAACGSKAGPVTSPTADPVAAQTAAAGTYPVADLTGEQQCWLGTMTMEMSTGSKVASQTLMRRAWDAGTSMVTEETASWTGAGAPTHGHAAYKLEGATAKFVSNYAGPTTGTMNGTVTFTGEPGKWSGWASELDASGTLVKTKYTLGADQGVTIEGNMFSKGAQIAQVTGTLAALEAAACKTEFSKVPPMK